MNGELTAGENIADMGGIKLAYQAWTRLEKEEGTDAVKESEVQGLSKKQLFFVAAAQGWCHSSTDEATKMRVNTDPHSPPQFRINGPMSQMSEFAEAFQCSPNDPMYNSQRVSLW